jgi:hypothetical protein
MRRLVRLPDQRSAGAFFTGSRLSRLAVGVLSQRQSKRATILDPACGVGDLFVACAERLPVQATLSRTLKQWGRQLFGRDLHEEFVSAAKARLVLAAIRRGVRYGRLPQDVPEEWFPNLKSGCGLSDLGLVRGARYIVMNPPFTMVTAPSTCSWSSGVVSCAAIFLETCLRHARRGTRIIAILPEVLRGGSRYAEWRRIVESHSCLNRLELFGQFDRWADVDVFVLDVTVTAEGRCSWDWGCPPDEPRQCVGDRFSVSVGPVVDYRDAHKGPWLPFVDVQNVPPWKTVSRVSQHRRFNGRAIFPPFVVVRRTSRLGDQYRAVASIVSGKKPVAVENHLLVLCPHDGRLESCEELVQVLRRSETSAWLNQRIRCRHLTVSALGKVPWWNDD